MKESLIKKKQSLRNNEYYTMQNTFDKLYSKATKGKIFNSLMQYITSEDNILLAYRNIKNNKGSTTVGTDKQNLDYYKTKNPKEFVDYFQRKFANYTPKSVRRVEITKYNGKIRPLGIPCMDDRIIQQCIKQVIEPICESKFHNHSYGFRPNRSTHHAIARSMSLMNKAKLHYVVDIDIKGFFDNVNHNKLKKQLWKIGIQDKTLMAIIGKILKAPIQDIGIPNKGTPQGGILSPLLSNVVLNELDWWISSQWETFETKHQYADSGKKYRALKTVNLKEIFLVRYADDFKIFCRDYKVAQKIYNATRLWLKERLGLEISHEKSRITNLRKNYTEFLGFKLIVKPKRNRYVCQSNMCNKAKIITVEKLKKQIKRLQLNVTTQQVNRLNAIILGSHNYYKIATQVTSDFRDINFLVSKSLDIRLKKHISNRPKLTNTYKKIYGAYNGKIKTICNVSIFPIYGCKTKAPLSFTQETSDYTIEGRKYIHSKLKGYDRLIEYCLDNIINTQSTEFNDNSISRIIAQQGKCFITDKILKIGNMMCHHKKPKLRGGTDEFKNLIWLCTEAYNLIYETSQENIERYINLLSLGKKGLDNVNSLRKLVGNSVI
ncbi:group II intron reverse transcriptase/maturase [Clostridium sporogenes]|uniref:group II intron reverse transcriptase/maturase n=1 Tax=Clostridium sporogenes TaxID=1509 RepID=UPI0020A12894|nr:group II intron reverse transcriptase/maturase [Clostridium sporogenes]